MKVELTARDIELMLSLLAESADDGMLFSSSPMHATAEAALLEKLEAALRKAGHADKSIMDASSGGYSN